MQKEKEKTRFPQTKPHKHKSLNPLRHNGFRGFLKKIKHPLGERESKNSIKAKVLEKIFYAIFAFALRLLVS
jgi:hypothetical protein